MRSPISVKIPKNSESAFPNNRIHHFDLTSGCPPCVWNASCKTCAVSPALCRCCSTLFWNCGINARAAPDRHGLSGDWKAGRRISKTGRCNPKSVFGN
jgi:hypothetical protein